MSRKLYVLMMKSKRLYLFVCLFCVAFGYLLAIGADHIRDLANKELNIGYIPVYGACKKAFKDFYRKQGPYIKYRYVEFPVNLKDPIIVGFIEAKGKISKKSLELFPSYDAMPCMPNAYTEGVLSDSFDHLLLSLQRVRQLGSENIYISVKGDSYIMKYKHDN